MPTAELKKMCPVKRGAKKTAKCGHHFKQTKGQMTTWDYDDVFESKAYHHVSNSKARYEDEERLNEWEYGDDGMFCLQRICS